MSILFHNMISFFGKLQGFSKRHKLVDDVMEARSLFGTQEPAVKLRGSNEKIQVPRTIEANQKNVFTCVSSIF